MVCTEEYGVRNWGVVNFGCSRDLRVLPWSVLCESLRNWWVWCVMVAKIVCIEENGVRHYWVSYGCSRSLSVLFWFALDEMVGNWWVW